MNEENSYLHEFGKFRLDARKKTLWHDGAPVPMPLKEIELLCVLVENYGQMVTKEDLLNKVWEDSFVEESNLSRHIYLLRKTFKGFGESEELIQNIPRRGYRFTGDVRQVTSGDLVIEKYTSSQTLIEIQDDSSDLYEVAKQVSTRPRFRLSPGSILSVAALALIVIAGTFFVSDMRPTSAVDSAATINSIAVLPIKSFSATTGDEELRLRLTDALITRLGSLGDIAVRPTNAVWSFARSDQDARDVGRQLGVDAVLDGRIQQEGDRLRVTIQLIRVATGENLWSDQFDGQADQILNLQDLISAKILQSLDANKGDRPALARRPTDNPEAYEAYLRGRYHWNQRSLEGFNKALPFFEQAIALDPKFADAYAGLSDIHLGFYDYGYKSAADSIPLAMEAVNRSLLLDPSSSEAYSALGSIQFLYGRNWTEAEKALQKAIELKPNKPTPHLRYGWMLTVVGDLDRGLTELRIAQELDPTSPIIRANIGFNYLCRKDFDMAEKEFNAIINDNSTFSLPYWYLGTIYFQTGRKGLALEKYLKAFALDGNSKLVEEIRKRLAGGGEAQALQFWLGELEKLYRKDYLPPSNIAFVAALQKDRKKTLYWLSESEKIRDPWLMQINYDSEYDFLREDQSFINILNKLLLKGAQPE